MSDPAHPPGMSDTQARQPAGAPTGGQFAATTRPEADVTLAAPDWETTRQRLDELVAEVNRAKPRIARLAMKAVGQRILVAEPRAAHVLLEWADQGFGHEEWSASEVFDADGERITWHVRDLAGDDEQGDYLHDDVHAALADVRGPDDAMESDAFGTPGDRDRFGFAGGNRVLLDVRAAAADDVA